MAHAPRTSSPQPAGPVADAGATLTEVLVAIFVLALGLLALLTLFPLGALNMAQAINDDRTSAFAADAVAFGNDGEKLLVDTARFVQVSLAKRSVDPVVVDELRHRHELLQAEAEHLEVRLLELRSAFPPQLIQPHVGPLLAEIRAIKVRLRAIIKLLSVV